MKTLFSFIHGNSSIRLKQPIAVTWEQCHEACPGWIHTNYDETPDLERCDECRRFSTDEDAGESRALECPVCPPP